MTTQNLWMQKSHSKREVYNNTILPQETRKTLSRQPNFTPKTTGKRTKIPQNQQKERNHKDPSRNKWKRNKETHVLNDTLDEMGLTDIFRTFHPIAEE